MQQFKKWFTGNYTKRDRQQRYLELIVQNKGIIYKVVYAYCQNPEDRNDLVQEIQAQLWRCLDKYDPQYKISTWIYRIALNTAISFYRKREKDQNTYSLPDGEEFLSIDSTSFELDLDENVRLLYQFIGELAELDKAIMLLYLEEESYQSIAENLGISKSNVSTKINRIKSKLQNRFYTQEQE